MSNIFQTFSERIVLIFLQEKVSDNTGILVELLGIQEAFFFSFRIQKMSETKQAEPPSYNRRLEFGLLEMSSENDYIGWVAFNVLTENNILHSQQI